MSIHRVVQSTRLKTLSQDERQEAFDVVLSILATCFPKQIVGTHMHELWKGCETFLAHVLAFDKAVQRWQPSFGEQNAVYVNMMCDVTWYLWEIGQYNEALRLLESTERICARTIGLNNLEGARIFVNRGSVFSTLNRYKDAGKLFANALHIRRRILPGDHQLLANSYMQMGNYYLNTSSGTTGIEDAIQAHEKVIETRLKSSTTKPTDMIVSYLNFCRSLMMGGRLNDAQANLAKAEELEGKVRDGRTHLYYRNHRLFILGNILARRGKVEMALDAHREVYNIRRNLKVQSYALGISLHKIGTLQHRLGNQYQAINTLKEAIPLLESFLGPTEAKLARLARTEMTLAEVLATGHEAASWRERALQHYCQAVGREEPVDDWSRIDFDALVPVIDR
ncbi:Clustered mitochondria protein [Madurella mycetomatis]|uniref:Clustered mitochondria protein n=1 Tax=Madurella mycetomatis TaxID=100816 RepID=A0A175W6W8_9PEZI|nr:Clustered mitochondria protein [Madurella mycetomatis]